MRQDREERRGAGSGWREPGPVGGALESLLLLAAVLPLALRLRVPSLWFLAPVLVIVVRGEPPERYGLTLRDLGSWRWHARVAGVVFGAYVVAHWAYATVLRGASFHPELRADFGRYAIEQFLVVGLSEEVFFRGYLQTRLDRLWGRPWRVLGARCGPGLIVASLLFGACHVVTGDLTRFRTALFGLFAGWLRASRSSIAVPSAYHGMSNVLYDVMSRSLR